MKLDLLPYKKYLQLIVVLAGLSVIALGFWTMYQTGATNMKHKKNAEISQLKQDHADAKTKAAQEYAEKLKIVNAQIQAKQVLAEQISTDLDKANAQNKVLANQVKKGISHAIEQDSVGSCANGLGANSLRLYREALGYSAS